MNFTKCRLMGLALGPQLPPLDVKSVIIIDLYLYLYYKASMLLTKIVLAFYAY